MMDSGRVKDMETLFQGGEEKDEGGKGRTVREEELLTPFKLDISQEMALKAIKAGRSMVVQGPPGTGKSQLICNLAADFCARGKNVLVVCEKRAALDVVQARLSSKGLGDFVALVHDFKNDRKKLFEQIASQADRLEEYRNANNRLDTVVMEREYVLASREIDRLTDQLEDFREALYGTGDCGISPKELYLTTDRSKPQVSLMQEYQSFRPVEVAPLLDKLSYVLRYAQQLERPGHPWASRSSFAAFGATDLPKIRQVLGSLTDFHVSLNQEIKAQLGADLDLHEAEWILAQKERLQELLGLLSSEQTLEYFRDALGHKTESLWLNNRERIIMQCFEGTPPEAELDIKEVSRVRAAIDHYLSSRQNPVAWLRWRFSKNWEHLRDALALNNLPKGKNGVKELRNRIDQRLNLQHNLTAIKTKTYLQGLPERVDIIALKLWFHHQKEAFSAKLIYDSLRSLVQYLPFKTADTAQLSNTVDRLFLLLEKIPEHRKQWLAYLSPVQVSHLIKTPTAVKAMQESLSRDFDALVNYDRAMAALSGEEAQVAKKLTAFLPGHTTEQVLDLFMNSLKLAWLDHVEAKNPLLKSISHGDIDHQTEMLREKVKVKGGLSRQIVQMRLRERTYEGVSYNRLQNRVTYRELTHQVKKKRKLWPLRKVMAQYGEEVFDLVPCWLASPETVSAVFEAEQEFDLVIFDEASQAFVEKALPSMYRARQTVIVGDAHQLRPNDLYRVTLDMEEVGEEQEVLTEMESLLELGEHHLPSAMLTSHYRSESLELIDFSNRHWYKGRLRFIPDRESLNSQRSALRHVMVADGVWENQQNRAEAEKVLGILLEMVQKEPGLTVGVVTMNYQQQQLILDMVEGEQSLQPLLDGEERLFVKNIENVQGDERDVILVSTGYAPDAEGRMRFNFGSLSGPHGANRLNVAITRARKRMVLVTSLPSETLQVTQAKNDGPRLLKEFLHYCEKVSERGFVPEKYQRKGRPSGWYLSDRVVERFSVEGYSAEVSDLSFADVNILEGDKLAMLMLTDDEMLFQSPSVKDNLVLLPMELERKHWTVSRRWSREWWRATAPPDGDTP